MSTVVIQLTMCCCLENFHVKLKNFPFQDNYEDEEQEVENGEEVKEEESPQLSLIKNLDSETLIPDLGSGNNEPNYENMDTMALLSSLNLQEPKPEEEHDSLLPNLN